jgi:NADH-quinone oxidoreductase subunit C
MNNTDLKNIISKQFPGAVIIEGKQFLTVEVHADLLHKTCLMLKNSQEISYDYLFCLTGVDLPDSVMTVYHLRSTQHMHELVLKTKTGRTDPVVDSVADIWPTAEYHEREIFDLLGIRFSNHPDLRRIFLDDTFGYPLRKDYKDEIRVVER